MVRFWKPKYDLLRILAAFSVVILHISAQFWYDFDVTDFRWLTANSYDALFRFGVPVFGGGALSLVSIIAHAVGKCNHAGL